MGYLDYAGLSRFLNDLKGSFATLAETQRIIDEYPGNQFQVDTTVQVDYVNHTVTYTATTPADEIIDAFEAGQYVTVHLAPIDDGMDETIETYLTMVGYSAPYEVEGQEYEEVIFTAWNMIDPMIAMIVNNQLIITNQGVDP